jgi:hypothetical protein
MLSIALNVATVAIDFVGLSNKTYFIPVASSAVAIMWLKLFYFGRMFSSTSTIVRMIIEISKDMVPFLVIIFVLLTGFTNSFFIIASNTKDPEAERFTGANFGLALTYTWRQGLGAFEIDQFEFNNHEELVYFIWLGCTFLVLIVLLNLLIAVLSDSFDKIMETLENNLLKELAIMMKDNEILLNKESIFKNVKYLIVIERVQTNSNDNSWGGRLDYVNKIIKRTRKTHFDLIDKINGRVGEFFDSSLDYRIGNMEQSTDKSMNYIVEKVDKLDNNLKLYKDAFTRIMAV